MVTGQVRPPKSGEKYFGLLKVVTVNGIESGNRPQTPPL